MFDLHMHTVFSDGKNTAEEMVQEAIRKGLETVGISDHSSGDPCGMKLEENVLYKAEIGRLKETAREKALPTRRLSCFVKASIYDSSSWAL